MRKPREPSRILKKFPARLDEVAREKAVDVGKIEIWFADEARIGQKNKIARRWAKRGTRPSAPRDQRSASTYIFGAICPKQGKGAALILPSCNTEAMNLHLAEIAKAVAPGAHAVLLVDQAGWHLSARLLIPANITIIPLPSKCPELNPVENIWQYMRDNRLSNRVFKSYDDIVDHRIGSNSLSQFGICGVGDANCRECRANCLHHNSLCNINDLLAEGEGFELPVQF